MATLPNPNPIPNMATFFYQYQVSATQTISTSLNTNQVFTQINLASLSQTKTSNVNYVKVGDTVTYTISLYNSGNVDALNINFIDTIPTGTTFVPNSVYVNSIANAGNPGAGIILASIPANTTTTISFNVIVNTIPTPNPIQNQSVVSYNFLVDPTSTPVSSSGISNIKTTQVNQAIIDNGNGLVKSINKLNATVGDTLTYTILLKNTGNVTANNVIFTDTLPTITSLVPNSVTLNSVIQPGATVEPPTGINIGSLAANSTATITFTVLVNTLPTSNPISNSGTVNYTFTVDPSVPNGASGSGNSNNVTSSIYKASIDSSTGGMIKSVDKAYADIGDTLTFTTALTNTGNTIANGVVFTDTLPTGTTLVPNSVFINGVVQPSGNPSPPTGISLGSITPGSTTTVIFSVLVVSIPTPNPIQNSANVRFTFTSDPSIPNGNSSSGNSNVTTTQINNANFNSANSGIIKSVNNGYANINDTLIYTIVLKNLGNVSANNTILIDTIPNYTNFVANSVYVNNILQSGANPNVGINIGTINSNSTTTVSFSVTVISLPTPNPIQNSAVVNYNYTIDPSIPNGKSSSNGSGIVSTTVSTAIIGNSSGTNTGFVKTVNNNYSKVGDILTYTIVLNNTGNTAANNIVLIDTTPNDTTFINNSVIINNVSMPGANPNPPTGISIATLSPNNTTTVSFSVTVNTIPTINPIPNGANISYKFTSNPNNPNGSSSTSNTNLVSTQINQATIDSTNGSGLLKTSNPSFVKVNDTVTYTIIVKNTGNVTANNIIFTDTIPPGTSFINNSVTLNNIVQSGTNPQSGITVGSLAPNNIATITFQVIVVTIPTPNPIQNSGTVNYTFTVDPSIPNGASASGNSNINTTTVSQATIDYGNGNGLIKSVNKTYGTVGDTLTYTITLKNTGNTTANNVVFTDTLPSITSLVPNSVTLNGVNQPGATVEPPIGLNVGSILPNGVSTITFTVLINTLPITNPIENSGTVNYNFTVDPSVPNGASGSGNSNTITNSIYKASIDTATGGMNKTVNKSYADIGDILTFTTALTNTGNTAANNVIFIDTLPTGTTLVPNSVTINGIAQSGVSPAPPAGIALGTINIGNTVTVSFSVLVVSIPSPNPIQNSANVRFTFTTDPSVPNSNSGSGNSNITTTQVNNANFLSSNLGFVKTVNNNYANINDTLTYTLVLKNLGNVPATNTVLIDTIPTYTTFIPNSVYINNILQPGSNPSSGLTLGTINPGVTTTIVFTVTITALPTTNPVQNSAVLNYTYTIDPSTPNGKVSSNLSPIVSTTVSAAIIGDPSGSTNSFSKTVSTSYAKLGDILTYTIVLTNTGNTAANNIRLVDTVPNGSVLVNNSVKINNIVSPGATPNPPSGISILTLAANNTTTISFNVLITTIPIPNPIVNSANLQYQYTSNPNNPNGSNSSSNTNNAITEINQAIIDSNNGNGFKKTSTPSFVKVNDIITYTILLTNTGNTTATNVVFTDTIQAGTSFVSNSVTINGSTITGANPESGVNVGSITPNSTVTITFQVIANTIPTPNPIQNSGTVNYNFTVNPSIPNGATGGGNSNINTTQVNQAIIDNNNGSGFIKSSNKAFADVGETITYTLSLKNTGNVPANNINIIDTIPAGTTFINNSLTFNGLVQPGATIVPPTGFNIPSLNPNGTAIITFNVFVYTLPSPNPLQNSSTINYNFTVDPSIPNGATGSGNSNITNSQINTATFTEGSGRFTKSVDKSNVTIGDIVKYTIAFLNGGNTAATNVVFKDTIPNGVVFVPNSFTLNGSLIPGANPTPPTGASIGIIPPGVTNTVTFNVQVVSLPSPSLISNSALLSYNYTINPSNPNGGSKTDISNNITSNVNVAEFSTVTNGFVKSQNKSVVELGDNITYSIVLTNSGNVTANNVIVYDTLPTSTSYVPWSTSINGVSVNINPQVGIPIGNINVNETVTITFTVVVNSVPSPNVITNTCDLAFSYIVDPTLGTTSYVRNTSNPSTASVLFANLSSNKSVNKQYADIGDTITYTIVYKNTGNVTLNNIILEDSIPIGSSFVVNSLKLNNNIIPGANPTTGYNLGNLNANTTSTVQFNVLVVSIPISNPVNNTATSTFNYIVDPSLPIKTGSSTATSGNTQINTASFNPDLGGFTKTANTLNATLGSTITYTIVLTNLGTVKAENILFTDTVPAGTTFIPGSVSINGAASSANILNGVSLSSINPKASTTITFSVLVTSATPDFNIQNQGKVSYAYSVNPSEPLKTNVNLSNITNILENIAQVSINKVSNKSTLYYGSFVTYALIVKNSGNVNANNIFVIDTMPASLEFINGSLVIDNISEPTLNITTGITIPTLAPNSVTTLSFKAMAVSIPTGGKVSNIAYANYSYNSYPPLTTIVSTTISNPDQLIISYNLSNTKPLPPTSNCSTITNSTISNFKTLFDAVDTKDCMPDCLSPGNYTVTGLCTPEDYTCISSLISQYKMWQEDNLNSKFTFNSNISTIDSVSAKITILRNSKITTPNTGSCANLEGKLLSGYKNIIEGLVKFTITFLDSSGEFCKLDFFDLFSSYIVVPTQYGNCDLNIGGCIEDIIITKLCPDSIGLSTTMILYLIPNNTTCENIPCNCIYDPNLVSSISNSSLCSNIANFLNSCDLTWNEFNVFFTENSNLSNIGMLNSITADISNISYKLISSPKPIQESNEGLSLTGNMLLVSFIINVKINYTSTDGSNSMKRLNLRVPASSYIIVKNTTLCSSIYSINVCIEDIYACNLDGSNIFTNTTLLIKASLCTPPNCC